MQASKGNALPRKQPSIPLLYRVPRVHGYLMSFAGITAVSLETPQSLFEGLWQGCLLRGRVQWLGIPESHVLVASIKYMMYSQL